MIFKKLILNNIGPYEGYSHFDFNSKDDKNTILIGGKNGAGKTTFLTSVRLALYGPLAYGFKTESKEYLTKVSSLLNKKAMNSSSDNSFSIHISFTTLENLNNVDITIIRSWIVTGKSIKEKVDVIKNGVNLNDTQKDEFYGILRTNFPPSLLELCFFDGEDISELSGDDKLSTYIKDLSTKLFNLDLFLDLEHDLKAYISQSSRSNNERQLEKEKELIEDDLGKLLDKFKTLEEQLSNNKKQLEDSNEKYNAIKTDFSLHGGLIYEDRNRTQDEISLIEVKRKQVNEKIKEFTANELPFFIALPKLKQLVSQLKDEENFHISNIIKEKINSLPLSSLTEVLGNENHLDQEKALKHKLIEKLVDSKNVDTIHNASNTEAHQVYALLADTNRDNINAVSELKDENISDLNKLQKLKQKIKDNESSSEFNEMIISMEEYNKKIADLESEIKSITAQLNAISNEVTPINKKYEKIKLEIYNITKTKSSFNETEKILNISKKFQENQLRKKVRDVEYFSSKMLKELIRKDLFIRQIKIDYKTFKISIIDHDNLEINKDILSAGEKELLVLSIIWGTISSSKKQLPLVLDTLLGRLDLEHKHSVITKLIPKFSEQIIILSTDSEISKDLYKNLEPYIANEYTLNYDNYSKRTKIEPRFFNNFSAKVGTE